MLDIQKIQKHDCINNLVKTNMLCLLMLLCLISLPASGQKLKMGPTKTETPVPFGKLTYVIGFGWNEKAPDLRCIRIPDEEVNFPEEVNYKEILKKEGENVKIHQVAENTLSIELPKQEFGVALLCLNKARTLRQSLIINAARLDWLSTDQAEAGDTVRALGRGLINIELYPDRDTYDEPVSHAGYIQSNAKVVIKDVSGKFHHAEIIKTSSYDIHFQIPKGLATGKAKVYVHNGYGGNFGWSQPQELLIEERKPWPQEVFNVIDYGAVGDSYADDSEPIKKALDAALANGGGIIYFPRGGYHFNFTMRVPDKTVLRGESRAKSWLYLPDGYQTNAQDTSVKVAIAGEGAIGVENLSIHAVYVNMMVAAPVGEKIPEDWHKFNQQNWDSIPEADYSYVKNCRLLHNFTHLYHRRFGDPSFEKDFGYLKHEMVSHGKAVNVILKGKNIEVSGSEFQGKGSCVYIVDCNYSKVSDNVMHSGHRSNCISVQHSETGYEKVIIENNEFRAFATTHHSAFWMMHGGRNMYIANNKILSQFWVSDNEGILGHMWGYRFPLYIKKVKGNKIYLDKKRIVEYWDTAKTVVSNWLSPFYRNNNVPDLNLFEGKEVQVFRGQGLGQVNYIDKVEDDVIYLKDEFKTPLLPSSLLVVHEVTAYRNLVIADNTMEDCGQAVFFWGHGHEIIIDGNAGTRTGIIGAWSVVYSGNVAGGCHFFQIINNKTDEGRARVINHHHPGGRYMGGGIGNHYSCESAYPTSSGGALNYVGYIIRNNLLKNDCMINYTGYNDYFCQEEHFDKTDQKIVMPYDHIGFVIEENKHVSCKYGMALGTSVKAVIKNNQFEDVDIKVLKIKEADIIEVE
jgi:hypothetical protein